VSLCQGNEQCSVITGIRLFPGWFFSPETRFPERRFPDGHFPGKPFPGWSFSRMRRFPERLGQDKKVETDAVLIEPCTFRSSLTVVEDKHLA